MTQYILLRSAHSNHAIKVLSIHNTPQEASDERTVRMKAYATKLNADRDTAYQAGQESEALVTKDNISNLFFIQSVA